MSHPAQYCLNAVKEVSQKVTENFGNLTTQQLNWQPAPNKWSIAQCLDHLCVSNNSYDTEFERILNQQPFTNFWGKIPFLSGFWGNFLLKSVTPEVKTAMQAPPAFKPAQSNLPASILQDFEQSQQNFIGYLTRLQAVQNPDAIKMTSPALSLITYSLAQCLTILAHHELRHFGQALRVLQHPNFPTA